MSSFLTIVMFFAIAVFVFLRLLSVLGKRTGHEQDPMAGRLPREHADDPSHDDNVVSLPDRGPAPMTGPSIEDQIDRAARRGTPLHDGLTAITAADDSFAPRDFVEGAKGAYETIVTAFAAGNKDELEPLLAKDVYDSFAEVIDSRVEHNLRAETQVIGFREAAIEEAVLQGSTAEVRVKFVTEMITVTRNEDGAVIDGHPNTVAEVTDHWTFERDVTSADPNWQLVSTAL